MIFPRLPLRHIASFVFDRLFLGDNGSKTLCRALRHPFLELRKKDSDCILVVLARRPDSTQGNQDCVICGYRTVNRVYAGRFPVPLCRASFIAVAHCWALSQNVTAIDLSIRFVCGSLTRIRRAPIVDNRNARFGDFPPQSLSCFTLALETCSIYQDW